MKNSRRAIPIKNKPFLLALVLFLLVLCVLATRQWYELKKQFQQNGPQIVQEQLHQALGRKVTVSNVSLSLPSLMSLYELQVFEKNGNNIIFESPRLEINFSFLSLLTGIFRPKKIKIIAPNLQIFRTASGIFQIEPGTKDLQQPNAASAPPQSFSPKRPGSNINLNPNIIEIINGRAHLEDELDTIPQLDGHFDLHIRRSADSTKLAIQQASLTLRETSFFHHGLQGIISGATTFDIDTVSSNTQIAISEGSEIAIKSKITEYNTNPICTVEINASDFDLKNLALIKYPLFTLPKRTSLTGSFKAPNATLYNTPVGAVQASLLYEKQKWHFEALTFTFPEERGKISGSLIPQTYPNKGQAKATLLYQGIALPTLKVKDDAIPELNPKKWTSPLTINSELTIDIASYPAEITEMKLTSNNGDLFVAGSIDLFSGFTNMQGTYLKPATKNPENVQTRRLRENAVRVSLTGNITKLDIRTP